MNETTTTVTNREGNVDEIKYLLALNKKHSDLFISPKVSGERRLYRSKYPLEIIAYKCMDGRLNLSLMTETAPGIIQPMRNVGAKFVFGWPVVMDVITEHYEYALKKSGLVLLWRAITFQGEMLIVDARASMGTPMRHGHLLRA